jgi:Uri superfamily endonuclease
VFHGLLEELKPLDGGTYTLVILASRDFSVEVGRMGLIHFRAGLYTYTGSALSRKFGLYNRVSRHLRRYGKKLRWHVDYLLSVDVVDVKGLCASHSDFRFECNVAEAILKTLNGAPIIGFGCSDCKCPSHLHYFESMNYFELLDSILKLYVNLSLSPIKILLP